MIKEIKNSWKVSFSDRSFRNRVVFSIILLILILIILPHFLMFIENRQGVVLDDPVLKLFSPIDVTWITFLIIYAAVFFTILYLLKFPHQILFGVQTYILMIIFRMIGMYLLRLEPPAQMIGLKDPVVEIIGGTGTILTKDLFFSGHTATLFILYLVVQNGFLKKFLLLATILIALLVLLQHVHYSIDVFAAFFFSYTCYRIVKLLGKI